MIEHDPLCRLAHKPGALGLDPCEECEHVTKVRADERAKMSAEFWCYVCDRAMRLEWLNDVLGGPDRRTAYCSGCDYGYITFMEASDETP